MSESQEFVFPQTFARRIRVTRQMLVNDDLGAFTDFASMIGRRVADFENARAYALVNSANGDGPTLVTGTAPVFASGAIIELDAAMLAGRLRQDGNPVLEWCLGNVVGKADRHGNLYPTKQRPEQKIDAAVALMMAVGRAMAADDGQPDLMEFLLNGMADAEG